MTTPLDIVRGTTLVLGLLAQPALATEPLTADTVAELTMQVADSDPALRMQGGIALCLGLLEGDGDQRQFLRDAGWRDAEWGGLVEYSKDGGQILISDAFFCDVSEFQVSQAEARTYLQQILADSRQTGWTPGQTDMGCFELSGPSGRIVVSSEGQDPICTPTQGSAVRFWWPPQ